MVGYGWYLTDKDCKDGYVGSYCFTSIHDISRRIMVLLPGFFLMSVLKPQVTYHVSGSVGHGLCEMAEFRTCFDPIHEN